MFNILTKEHIYFYSGIRTRVSRVVTSTPTGMEKITGHYKIGTYNNT